MYDAEMLGRRRVENNTINGKLCEKVLRMARCAANQVAKQELGSHSR